MTLDIMTHDLAHRGASKNVVKIIAFEAHYVTFVWFSFRPHCQVKSGSCILNHFRSIKTTTEVLYLPEKKPRCVDAPNIFMYLFCVRWRFLFLWSFSNFDFEMYSGHEVPIPIQLCTSQKEHFTGSSCHIEREKMAEDYEQKRANLWSNSKIYRAEERRWPLIFPPVFEFRTT